MPPWSFDDDHCHQTEFGQRLDKVMVSQPKQLHSCHLCYSIQRLHYLCCYSSCLIGMIRSNQVIPGLQTVIVVAKFVSSTLGGWAQPELWHELFLGEALILSSFQNCSTKCSKCVSFIICNQLRRNCSINVSFVEKQAKIVSIFKCWIEFNKFARRSNADGS